MVWTVGLLKNGPHKSVIESNGRIVNTYQRTYLVGTDSDSIPTEAAVVAAIGIDPGSPYENDANASCRGITGIDQLQTRAPWIKFAVAVEWATNATIPATVSTDPTTQRILWSIRPEIQQRYITRDRHDKLIVNGAGTPYNGGVPVAARLGVAVAKRKKDATGYDRDAVLANSGKLNSATYLGGAPGTVQVDIESDEKWEGAYHFWDETFTFHYDSQGHQPKVANQGFFAVPAGGGPVVPITVGMINYPPTADTTKVQEPEPLDSDGYIVPVPNRPDDCEFIDVDYFEEMDFDDFDLI